MARREKTAKLATRDPLESLVSEVLEERPVRREKPALQELPVPPVAVDPLAMMVPRVTLVLSASQETPVPLVSPVLVVLMVYPETKEMMERLDNLALQVHLVKLESQDLRAKGDLLDEQVRREDKEKRDPREKLEQRDPLGKRDLSDLRDLLENPVPKVCVESPAPSVSKDSLAPPVKMAHPALLDPPDFLE